MAEPLTIVIFTGASGAGKTIALHALEDLGFYCVDNLPLPLLTEFITTMKKEPRVQRVALVVDARFQQYLRTYSTVPSILAFGGENVEVIYFDATDDVLVRRFSQTRRRHPVVAADLPEALAKERALLAPLRAASTMCINTSDLNTHQLKQLIQDRYRTEQPQLFVSLLSFGFRYGLPPHADLIFDVRFLPNPYFVAELQPLTGQDPAVSSYVLGLPDTTEFLTRVEEMCTFLLPRFHAERKVYLTIAIGCTGGQHRSVAIAEELGRRLSKQIAVRVQHRDVAKAKAEH